jgi:cysteine desulfurase
VPPEAIATALRPDTLLVSLMLVNNEIGVINDVAAVAALAAARGVLVHSDASQALGKLPVDVRDLRVDFLSFTAHKIHGPKGMGALYVREAARPHIAPVQFGGGHERGLRSGTLPTHQAVGFGVAAALARSEQSRDAAHARDLAARLARELEDIPAVHFNSRGDGVPGLVNVSFDGVEGESLITGLPEIAVSTGSACSSASREASYVLRALGRSTELAQSSLRLSLGRFSVAADVDLAATAIRAEVARLRAIAGSTDGLAEARLDPDSSLASGNTLLGRSLNAIARRHFLAAPRPPRLPGGVFAGRKADGTAVRFELHMDVGTVKSARFSAYGCPHTVAVTAWLCEMLEGQKLEQFAPGSPAGWAEEFAVPTEKLGRLLVVEDALRAALELARQV